MKPMTLGAALCLKLGGAKNLGHLHGEHVTILFQSGREVGTAIVMTEYKPAQEEHEACVIVTLDHSRFYIKLTLQKEGRVREFDENMEFVKIQCKEDGRDVSDKLKQVFVGQANRELCNPDNPQLMIVDHRVATM